MSRTKRNKLIAAMNMSFSAIGNSATTSMPKASSNLSSVAWEYYVAQHVLALANGRVKKAKTDAIKAGVIPNYEETPLAPGEYPDLFDGEHVIIKLTVRNPSVSVDHKKMYDYLVGAGVSEDILSAAVTHASRTSRPAHLFTSDLKDDSVNGE